MPHSVLAEAEGKHFAAFCIEVPSFLPYTLSTPCYLALLPYTSLTYTAVTRDTP